VRAMSVWRRALLAAILPAVLGAIVVALLLGGDERHGASVETIAIESDAVGRTLPVSVVVPEGAGDEPRPLLVFLHGRDGDEQSGLTEEMYSALAEQGRLAPVVAFPNGGEASYWHDRADGAWGRWAAREVVDEVAARFRIDRERIAIGGISMGGFGALNLARIYPDRFCAVGGHSAALWRTEGRRPPARSTTRPTSSATTSWAPQLRTPPCTENARSGSTWGARTPSAQRSRSSRPRSRRAGPTWRRARGKGGTRARTGRTTGTSTCASTLPPSSAVPRAGCERRHVG
jgi:S-formylglutathione hydrolase FrmB